MPELATIEHAGKRSFQVRTIGMDKQQCKVATICNFQKKYSYKRQIYAMNYCKSARKGMDY
jgi:hypothetical protein